MGLIPSDAASIYGGQYRTVMLISSGYREHFGGPHVPDREFDIMYSILGIADAEDAITEAITGATAATSHLLVRALLRDTVPYRGRPFWLSSSNTMASRTF